MEPQPKVTLALFEPNELRNVGQRGWPATRIVDGNTQSDIALS
jgi:hypothetical protein